MVPRRAESGAADDASPGAASRRSLAPATARAAAILDELAVRPELPLGPSELARRLGIAKSSVANICQVLAAAGLVRRTEGGYQLGHRLVELGSAYLSSVNQVRVFHEVCRELRPEREETVQLSMLAAGLTVVYLARHDGTHPIRLASDVGRHLAASHAATGKAMLAALPPEEVRRRIEEHGGLPRPTDRSIRTLRELAAELDLVRARGYSVDDEETLEGMFCVGAHLPSTPYDGRVLGVSLTMLKAQANPDRVRQLAADVQALAREIAVRSGAGAPFQPS